MAAFLCLQDFSFVLIIRSAHQLDERNTKNMVGAAELEHLQQ